MPHNRPPAFPFDFAVLFLVAVPLLLIRRFESPRRRVSVWFFDLGRLVVGYASAEVLLLILLIPYTLKTSSFLHLHQPPPNDLQQFPNNKPPTARRKNWVPLRAETTSLTVSFLQLCPGLLFIYSFYLILLHLAYRLKKLYLHRFSCPDPYSDSPRKHLSQTDLGLASGNYGHPVRLAWAVQQTALFATAVFFVRLSIFSLCFRFPTATNSLRSSLFGWVASLSSHPAKWALSTIVFPALIYLAQFTISDYLLKYKPKKSKSHFPIQLPHASEAYTGTFEFANLEPQPTSTSTSSTQPLDIVHQNEDSDDDLYDPPTRSPNLEQEIEETFHDIKELGKTAWERVAKTVDASRQNIAASFPSSSFTPFTPFTPGTRLGLVTASLLNQVAANATATARPLLFTNSVVDQFRLDDVDDTIPPAPAIDNPFHHDTTDPLPNYYESQREHQELLRDREGAEQRRRQIRDLKRE